MATLPTIRNGAKAKRMRDDEATLSPEQREKAYKTAQSIKDARKAIESYGCEGLQSAEDFTAELRSEKL